MTPFYPTKSGRLDSPELVKLNPQKINQGSLQGSTTQQKPIQPQAPATLGSPPQQPTSPFALAQVMDALKSKVQSNNALMTQRNLLLKHLYDQPLNDEEKKLLDPTMLSALNDRNQVDIKLRLISDEIAGRTSTLDSSVKYLTDNYWKSIDQAEKQKQDAINNVLDFAKVYGSNAKTALASLYGPEYVEQLKDYGIDLDSFAGVEPTSSGGGGGFTPAQINSTINSIAGAFDNEPIVKTYNTALEGIQTLKSMGTATKSPADDIAFIYAFAKLMDPNSVVREGEYNTIQKYAQTWADTFGFKAKRIFSNTNFLGEDAKKKMLSAVQSKFNSLETQYKNLHSEYQRQIDQARTGQPRKITDYSKAFPPSENTGTIYQSTSGKTYKLPF